VRVKLLCEFTDTWLEGLISIMVTRLDSREKVTGEASYTGDIFLPDLLYGKILRSPLPHAKIVSIDTEPALKLSGVQAALSHKDLRDFDTLLGNYIIDRPVLARDRVRYSGEPVAVVAAEKEFIAEEALHLIEVEYEDLPPVLSLEDAIAPHATLVHEELGTYKVRAARPVPGTNFLHVTGYDVGNVDAAFREPGVVIVEDEFRFPMIYHYALEPHTSVARADSDGITIWTSTQSPFSVRDTLARIFKLPVNRVRVITPYVGGGFGSKSQTSSLEPLSVALALKTGRPVKISYSVTEAMLTTRRLGMYCRIRTGARPDGTLVGRECDIYLDNGAYAMIGPTITDKAANRVLGPYRFPNLKVKAQAAYTNTVPAGSFRAVGAPQAVWAGESQIDILAARLGLDPLEFRKRNLLRRGEVPRPGMRPMDADLSQLLDRAAASMRWGERSTKPNRAMGMAMAMSDPGAAPPSIALARFNSDGSLTVLVGSTEIGQGSRTILSQIAAAELGVPLEMVYVAQADTLNGPFDPRTSSSRTTTVTGTAVQEAVRDVKNQLLSMTSRVWKKDLYSLRWSEGKIGDGTRWIAAADVVREVFGGEGGEVIGKGIVIPGQGMDDQGYRPLFYESGVGMVEVEVDPDTGAIRVLRYVGAADIGKAINLAQCLGQEEGAVMQGIGHTFFEEMRYEDGQLVNGTLADYRVPNFLDLPEEQEAIFIENLDGPGPGGAKGMGEGGIIPVAAAVGNALAGATGVRFRDLPLKPDLVWESVVIVKRIA
jgi:CO/xanthine dehydrogenase Mo-binding subunit